MKNFNETFNAFLKAKPRIIMLECPEFIVKAFLPKSRIAPQKAETFWDITCAESAKPSAIKAYQYQPEY